MIQTQLPARGPGFVTYNREANGADQYGTAKTVAALLAIGQAWAKLNPARPFSVGDLSRKGGGRFPPHSKHRLGTDADLRPLRQDGQNLPCTWQAAEYSRDLTRALILTIKSNAPGARVLFNDPQLIKEGLCSRWPSHDNHLHVSFTA